MKVSYVSIKNFRRLEEVRVSFEDDHTLFVGPNNSGKTSAAAAFRLFFKRADFSINDFTVACIDKINNFGADAGTSPDVLPVIQLDAWMSIDPDVEFGRVFSLLPNVFEDFDRVGIRLRFCAKDAEAMREEYNATFPESEDGVRRTLSHFLSLPNALSRHFAIRYFALEDHGEVKAIEVEPDEGKRLLHSLIRVDFIDAQRNIHDQEGGRQNRLSSAFAAYYKHNLQKPEENEAANKVIDANNASLTAHYKEHFAPLFQVIAGLGVPSAHDREMMLVSSLSAQEALRGNTELYYVDPGLQHELPEAYNGLGFKNLVYMAIQISHFHSQWLMTEKNRELCQLIFVEEPEVHLHAQVQQIFVSNMWKILKKVAEDAGESGAAPQLVITTHSSHIVDTVDFAKIRYFRRCHADGYAAGTLNASHVLNIKEFRPTEESVEEAASEVEEDAALALARKQLREEEILRFLKKYLRLTHCDLFFADAAILVEGTVEKLLLPSMIEKVAPGLCNKYLTVLEVGGAFAHRFSGLLKFLGIPYVVITDIDTVDPANARTACRAARPDSKTSNAALKAYFGTNSRADLVGLSEEAMVRDDGSCYVTFQRPVTTKIDQLEGELHGRTLEESFVYENLDLFRKGLLPFDRDLSGTDLEALSESVYDEIRSNTFKKTEFALNIVSSSVNWVTPLYIAGGLQWLARKLEPTPLEVRATPAAESAPVMEGAPA